MFELGIRQLNAMAGLVDELILDKNKKSELTKFLKVHTETDFVFLDGFCEGYFYYILGNCSSELYQYHHEDWYSQSLIDTVNLYEKSVFLLEKHKSDTGLLSFALTNLGNFLSSQGRFFCAQFYWDKAIELDGNSVALIAKAEGMLFRGTQLFDESHTQIHYYYCNNLIKTALENLDKLEEEQKIPLLTNGTLNRFHSWFENNFKLEDFNFLEAYKQKTRSKVEARYLKWVADNKLFINDLNDLCKYEIVYQDILGLPSINYKINNLLSLKESLVFHSNFDELRNDFTYARFLIFQASEMSSESRHFYNQTYPHTDDTLHAVDNLKTSHMKSAFKILYSIFDKSAYLLAKYLNLNIGNREISFSKIFGRNENKKFKPRVELKKSTNFFLHALFYILKEIEDGSQVQDEKHRLAKIRNHLEHRSFRIVDDFGYELNTKYDQVTPYNYNKALEKKAYLEEKNLINSSEYQKLISDINDKKIKKDYIFEMPLAEFEKSLMDLARLVRNSIMYLSLAIHFEETQKLDHDDDLILEKTVPLKR
ncbi:LA2681 family HEPN domain-containing protein [Acinetobacter sp.]|uniref:LA2681 family HEPN domain-containing protein n=1 Tax=Acinetobacter sp. TaxID=472 RepID=UPI003D05DB4F